MSGRFESPWQVATLFVGAALVAALLLTILTQEALHRKNALRDGLQTTTPSPSFLSSLKSKLQRAMWPSSDSETPPWKAARVRREAPHVTTNVSPTTHHKLRHHFPRQRQHSRHLYQGFITTASSALVQESSTTTTGMAHPEANGTTSNTTEEDVSKIQSKKEDSRWLPLHPCYGPSQVLLVVAMTCGVNLLFVALLLACVRLSSTDKVASRGNNKLVIQGFESGFSDAAESGLLWLQSPLLATGKMRDDARTHSLEDVRLLVAEA